MMENFPIQDWREIIQQWVARNDLITPLAQETMEYMAWKIAPPTLEDWPAHLPTCQALHDFYRFCDGGYFNWFNWFSLSELVRENRHWLELLSDWDERGNVLSPERHVVLAVDGGGCPVVWDAVTDQVAAFQFDGGDWEPPLAPSVEAFLADLFHPQAENMGNNWWYLFLRATATSEEFSAYASSPEKNVQ